MKMYVTLIAVVVVMLSVANPAYAGGDYRERDDRSVGVEVNILWPFPPFRTLEFKLRGKLGNGIEAVIGYGRQAWIYKGDRHNKGEMDSHALLLGARAFPFHKVDYVQNVSVEYTAWLGRDVFKHVNGNTYRGFSYANEFYLGYAYYFAQSPVYIHPQWNWGFYSYKNYTMPLNDNYVFDFLPKISLGMDF